MNSVLVVGPRLSGKSTLIARLCGGVRLIPSDFSFVTKLVPRDKDGFVVVVSRSTGKTVNDVATGEDVLTLLERIEEETDIKEVQVLGKVPAITYAPYHLPYVDDSSTVVYVTQFCLCLVEFNLVPLQTCCARFSGKKIVLCFNTLDGLTGEKMDVKADHIRAEEPVKGAEVVLLENLEGTPDQFVYFQDLLWGTKGGEVKKLKQ
jgi:hypothetical protein